ncbi:hypothetical protein G7Y89_g10436 [Cudoniella acicularis]|uniref:Uncharacterized protein n=1 Tax=Cudoniella acicularis TaxID=354080 RepID=A0A8H4RCS4_9HELO|nr:hypothetical protein G7Y89_g10436 [Cudoniella acicularis]
MTRSVQKEIARMPFPLQKLIIRPADRRAELKVGCLLPRDFLNRNGSTSEIACMQNPVQGEPDGIESARSPNVTRLTQDRRRRTQGDEVVRVEQWLRAQGQDEVQ